MVVPIYSTNNPIATWATNIKFRINRASPITKKAARAAFFVLTNLRLPFFIRWGSIART